MADLCVLTGNRNHGFCKLSDVKIFFLLNPSQPKYQWDYREAAARAAHRFGWTARFGQVDRERPLSSENLLRQALEEECTRIVAIGGDGTLHRAVNFLWRQNRLKTIEIAVAPAGTCNDFARAMGLSRKKFDEALRVACAGHPRATDLALMDDEMFLNNAGFGRRLVPAARRRLRPLRALRSFQPIPLHATWEKGSIEGTFYMALACNSRFFSGGLYFSKNPRVNDGLLDIYLVPRMTKWKLLPRLLMGRLGRPVGSRQIVTLRVHHLDIETTVDLWPQADGEPPVKATRRVRFSIAPEKAMIVAPEKLKEPSLWGQPT